MNVVRFILPTARDLYISGVGKFRAGVLDIDANNTLLITRARYLVQPYRAIELGVVDSTTPPPTLPILPGEPVDDPYPQYLADNDLLIPSSGAAIAIKALSMEAVEEAPTVEPSGAWDFEQEPTVNGVPISSTDTLIPDASSTVKGAVRLSGDLGGTALNPTVPGLALKAATTYVDAAITSAKARANHTGTQPSSTLSDLTETVQDIVAAFLAAGTGISVTYNDVANTYTINAAQGTGTDAEVVRDTIGGALVAGAGVTITVNDAGDTITIASSAVLPTRQIVAGTGLTGGGDLSADRTLAVAYGTTATTAAAGNDSRLSNARTPIAHAASHATASTDPIAPGTIGAVANTGGVAANRVMTQAAWDAATKDASTIYFIVG